MSQITTLTTATTATTHRARAGRRMRHLGGVRPTQAPGSRPGTAVGDSAFVGQRVSPRRRWLSAVALTCAVVLWSCVDIVLLTVH